LTYPDNSTNSLDKDQLFEQISDEPDSPKYELVTPEKTPVKDIDNLTDEDKNKAIDEIKKANPNAKDVSIDENGKATLTYPDNSTNSLDKDQLFEQMPDNQLYNPVADSIEKNFGENTTQEEVFSKITIPDYPEDKQKPEFTIKEDTNLPDGKISGEYKVPVIVTYPDNSTDEIEVTINVKEKPDIELYKPVADSIEKNFGENTTQEEVFSKITIPDYPKDKQKPEFTIKEDTNLPDGKISGEYKVPVIVTYPDKTTDEIEVTINVKEQPDNIKYEVVAPEKTPVKDIDNLTDEDKNKAIDEIKKANPNAKDVSIDENGKATLTYPDNSTNSLDKDQLFEQMPDNQLYNPV